MLTLIAAIAENGAIGKNGQLVWRNKDDMAHFKKLTLGKTVLMGRKTWESIPEKFRPLPDRINAVVTRQTDYQLPADVRRFLSIDEALETLKNEEVMVIGGAELYKETLPRADKLEITEVKQKLEGDTFFPTIETEFWKETTREDYDGYSFVTYEHK